MKIGRRTWLRWFREETRSTWSWRIILVRNKKVPTPDAEWNLR